MWILSLKPLNLPLALGGGGTMQFNMVQNIITNYSPTSSLINFKHRTFTGSYYCLECHPSVSCSRLRVSVKNPCPPVPEVVSSLSRVQLLATPWTVACQAPLSLEFSRQGYWSGLLCPSPGDRPNPGIKPASPASASKFFTTSATWEADTYWGEA